MSALLVNYLDVFRWNSILLPLVPIPVGVVEGLDGVDLEGVDALHLAHVDGLGRAPRVRVVLGGRLIWGKEGKKSLRGAKYSGNHSGCELSDQNCCPEGLSCLA